MGLELMAPLEPTYTQGTVSDWTITLNETAPPVPTPKKPKSKVKRNNGTVNWASRDARNRSLGDQGEGLVLHFEKERLKRCRAG